MKLSTTIFILLLSAFATNAQIIDIVKGKVLDKSTLEPIPFANIYVNNTTIGTQTNEDGVFSIKVSTIKNVQLIVSSIGYKSLEKSLNIGENIIELEPDNTQLAEIKVSSKKDKKWISLYKDFEKVFLGSSEAAKFCKILQPWQIDLTKINNVLIAKTTQPIEIVNHYLGYKVFWYLKSFESSSQSFSITGNSRSELLKAKNRKEADYWSRNRSEAYKGSLEHFLKSLYKGNAASEGYKIYQETVLGKGKNRNSNFGNELNIKKTVQEINPVSLVICQNKKCFLNLENQIEVHFINKNENKPSYSDIPYQVSWVDGLEKMVAFDSLGHLDKPSNLLTSGSMNQGRIAELLPLDYQLNESESPKVLPKYWQESVKLYTQKAFYHPSERVWMKATMNYENRAFRDSLSKILYVDLISPQKKIIASQQWEIYNGEANGDILLPDSMQTGIYYLRAYTNWMRNDDDSTIFYKTLPILNYNQRVDSENPKEIFIDNLALKLSKEKLFVGDSLEVTLQGIPYHSYSISVLNEKLVNCVETNSTEFLQKKLTNILFPIEKSFSISGITKDQKGKGVESKITLVDVVNNNFSEIETDKIGSFMIENIWGSDSLKYLIKATDLKGKKTRKIEIQEKNNLEIKIPILPKIEIINTTENEYIDNEIKNSVNATMLNTVTVKAKKNNNDDLTEKSKLYSRADYVVKASDFQNRVADENLITFLQGRVPGLNIQTAFNDGIKSYKIRVRGRSGMDQFSSPSEYEPLFLIDGIPTDIRILGTMNASQIDRIEVITRVEAMFGARGANGVIAVYSAKGKIPAQTQNYFDYQLINVQGINQPNIFVQNAENQSTLYWNPFVFTDYSGKATLKISVGNTPQNRIIQVIGIDENGKPSVVQKFFTVESL
jgi:CarboxypepD_reg-like domain